MGLGWCSWTRDSGGGWLFIGSLDELSWVITCFFFLFWALCFFDSEESAVRFVETPYKVHNSTILLFVDCISSVAIVVG